ncbi:uncharacterized protein LOC126756008 [Bactrocera neohumeralis]|uniref:uncharacterized protein LOC126756008 n=1 Tax=Bactrocera neohumeralis TaxID=98809 RepID=UPI0021659F2C|nr:uncharacterized protein LOC126756008 [Bactrocera neohumeralis]
MARVPIYNSFAVFLLVIGLACINADDTEDPEIDIETFGSRNQLLDSIFNDSLVLGEYLFARSEELCDKLIDDEMYRNETSEELESHDAVVKNCRRRVVDRLYPSEDRYGSKSEETLLLKYGFANIQKMVNQKYEEFFADIVQRMDNYVKGLTPEQQTRTTARNLSKWSDKIKDAPTLSMKNIFYNTCMRFYYFDRGV